jgi:hypothetical protein
MFLTVVGKDNFWPCVQSCLLHINQVGNAYLKVLIYPEHGIDGLGELCTATLVDAHRIHPAIADVSASFTHAPLYHVESICLVQLLQ